MSRQRASAPFPIFLVGMGRSGSTLLFETLATHRTLGWFGHHTNRAPSLLALHALSRLCDVSLAVRKSIERSDQSRRWVEKLRLGPAEAYETWSYLCGPRFRSEYLLGASASPADRDRIHRYVERMLRWSGKQRFIAKITGPPRIGYLRSVFPDAIFVHVVRDGRAVARSLLAVDFWRDTFRMHQPAWRNGFPMEYAQVWERSGHSPLALAALQWRAIVEYARKESADLDRDRYFEVRYEDFLADPAFGVRSLLVRCGLKPDPRVFRFLSSRFAVRDMNRASSSIGSSEDNARLESWIGPALHAYGYDVSTPASSR